MRVIGLMSGTSLDGIDAALITIREDDDGGVDWSLDAFHTTPYTAERRDEIHAAILKGDAPTLTRLHAQLGEWLAEAALAVCAAAGLEPDAVDLIGSHGQTVWHQPPAADRRGATLQLGCTATIAERTGIPVVGDFRARDMAAGGEGAPLVPWADRMLFAARDRTLLLQNIGGMANVTRVPPRGADEPLLAFDTGPGNAPIDAAVQLATGGREQFDRDGRWAARGVVDDALLDELLSDPFFQRPPPRSTGREAFGRPFVDALVSRRAPADEQAWADLVATLTMLTARSIAEAYRRWIEPRGADAIVLTGGGARNPTLRSWIERELAPLPVLAAEAAGIPAEAKEAVSFAALAWAHVLGRPGNVPEVTGAAGPRVLGCYTPGRRGRPQAGGEA